MKEVEEVVWPRDLASHFGTEIQFSNDQHSVMTNTNRQFCISDNMCERILVAESPIDM